MSKNTVEVLFIGNRPARQHVEDAASDLIITEDVTIPSGEHRVVPTGTRVSIPEGYVGKIYVRSSIGFKKHLTLSNGTGIIDAGFHGEIKLSLFNADSNPVTLHAGERVAQLMIDEVVPVEFLEVDEFEESTRGENGFGSTGA